MPFDPLPQPPAIDPARRKVVRLLARAIAAADEAKLYRSAYVIAGAAEAIAAGAEADLLDALEVLDDAPEPMVPADLYGRQMGEG